MFKYISSEKGGTLMIVFGFIVTLAIVVTPMAMSTNIGLLQAKTNGNTEAAFTEAHSSMTVFSHLYKSMLEEDEANNNEAAITALASEVEALSGLHADVEVIRDGANVPVKVRFTARAGAGNQVRSGKVDYRLTPLYEPPAATLPVVTPNPTPVTTPEPTATPQPTPATGMKVILSHELIEKKYNKLFAVCYRQPAIGQPLPLDQIINDYTEQQFKDWFEDAADYYLDLVPVAMAATFPQAFQDSRFETAAGVSHAVTGASLTVTQSRDAIQHTATVQIKPATSADMMINSDTSGLAVKTNGDLLFEGTINSNIVVNGRTEIGGKLQINSLNNGKTIVFKDDVIIRGDLQFGGSTVDTVIVEGDLIVGGHMTNSNVLKKLIVMGDMLVAGSVTTNNVLNMWHMDGKLIVKGDLTTNNNLTSFSVGRDASIQGNVIIKMPVAESMNGIQGLFRVQGSLQVLGSLEFRNTLYGLAIGGDLIVGSVLSFNHLKSGMAVGGSILVNNQIKFTNSVESFQIGENVVAGGQISFSHPIHNTFKVDGTMAAEGDIQIAFIQSDASMSIGGNLITASNLSVTGNIPGSLKLGGYLLAFKNANMPEMHKDWKSNGMTGFFVGGLTSFYSNYSQSWYSDGLDNGSTQERICIY
ncbi:hypothetical protein ACX1C1_17250 [Paenibacillus sp. strain BS8-2]